MTARARRKVLPPPFPASWREPWSTRPRCFGGRWTQSALRSRRCRWAEGGRGGGGGTAGRGLEWRALPPLSALPTPPAADEPCCPGESRDRPGPDLNWPDLQVSLCCQGLQPPSRFCALPWGESWGESSSSQDQRGRLLLRCLYQVQLLHWDENQGRAGQNSHHSDNSSLTFLSCVLSSLTPPSPPTTWLSPAPPPPRCPRRSPATRAAPPLRPPPCSPSCSAPGWPTTPGRRAGAGSGARGAPWWRWRRPSWGGRSARPAAPRPSGRGSARTVREIEIWNKQCNHFQTVRLTLLIENFVRKLLPPCWTWNLPSRHGEAPRISRPALPPPSSPPPLCLPSPSTPPQTTTATSPVTWRSPRRRKESPPRSPVMSQYSVSIFRTTLRETLQCWRQF